MTAEVVGSGIVRPGTERADIYVFVNRPTTNKRDTEPVISRDQVTVQMQRVDGEWLVDCLVTTPAVSAAEGGSPSSAVGRSTTHGFLITADRGGHGRNA